MRDHNRTGYAALGCLLLAGLALVSGCKSTDGYRLEADRVATRIIAGAQQEAVGRSEPIEIESPAASTRRALIIEQNLPHASPASLGLRDLQDSRYFKKSRHLRPPVERDGPEVGSDALTVSLMDALHLGALSSRDYQNAKEELVRAALALDRERDAFRSTTAGALAHLLGTDGSGDRVTGSNFGTDLSVSRRFKSGAQLAGGIAVDVVRLLTSPHSSSVGVRTDASLTIPLLRGADRRVVTEPLTQAERNMLYAVHDFERFKRSFAVSIASDYFGVLLQMQQARNQEENYRRLIASTRRAGRLAESGRLPEFQLDQAVQDELRARDRWIASRQSHAQRLDSFKMSLGLPPDADVVLDEGDLSLLEERGRHLVSRAPPVTGGAEGTSADAPVVLIEPTQEGAGPLEIEPDRAVRLALDNRLDLRTAIMGVADATRGVMVAADDLRAEVTLLGSGSAGEGRSIGSAGSDNATLRLREGNYTALLEIDLPLERTAERNAYRESLIRLERAVRTAQQSEDRVKLDVRGGLRDLLEAREGVLIQTQAVALAEKRVTSTNLFLEAGRAEIRDVLDAQDALLSAKNALSAALVAYRIAELELQRDLGLLEVSVDGLWREYQPEKE